MLFFNSSNELCVFLVVNQAVNRKGNWFNKMAFKQSTGRRPGRKAVELLPAILHGAPTAYFLVLPNTPSPCILLPHVPHTAQAISAPLLPKADLGGIGHAFGGCAAGLSSGLEGKWAEQTQGRRCSCGLSIVETCMWVWEALQPAQRTPGAAFSSLPITAQ